MVVEYSNVLFLGYELIKGGLLLVQCYVICEELLLYYVCVGMGGICNVEKKFISIYDFVYCVYLLSFVV